VVRCWRLGLLFVVACRKETPPPVPDAAAAREPVVAADGGLDPACEGIEVPFTRWFDARCAVSERAFDGMVDAGTAGLVFLARREGRGVVVTIANPTETPIDVPFRAHSERPELAPFGVLAEDEARAVYELRPPRLEVDAGAKVHRSRVRLAPGGTVRIPLAIDPAVERRLEVPDASAPARLRPGRYVLHIEPLGFPAPLPLAHVSWELTP